MKIVFGLGNPGLQYKNNYHNLGFMALDELAEKLNCPIDKKGRKGIFGEKLLNGEKIMLVKPQTFMNLSGECVSETVNFYKCDISDILVIYDDIDIDKGLIRFRPHGSAGTHNGMRSIVQCLGNDGFARLRVGSKNTRNIPLIEYVLSNITSDEYTLLTPAISRAAECAYSFCLGKTFDELMCEFNRS